jgi:acyl-CoA thioesterase-1
MLASAALGGCGSREAPPESVSRDTRTERSVEVEDPIPASAAEGRPRIVLLGDSLTAGLGLSPDQAYPALLQQHVDEANLPFEIVSAGVSGDTSAGGLRRLDWALEGDVRIVVIALGGNDGLRGIPVDELRRNLSAMIERCRARGLNVVIAGMEAPPNFGDAYTAAFRKVYSDLAREHDVPLVPFLLEGVAGIPSLNQRDGIHPNVAGAKIVADNVWKVVQPLAERQAGAARGGKAAGR